MRLDEAEEILAASEFIAPWTVIGETEHTPYWYIDKLRAALYWALNQIEEPF